ncbi:thiolase-like protein, partial [Rhodocollybia butyracea]
VSCRTAGGNDSPEKLWQFLLDKKDASGEVPRWRWEPWLRRDTRNAKAIENTISKGYFIPDLENFDALFFGISPKEAEQMDPHQRLALELTWEALENAGISPKSLAGSDTAVFMGVDTDDYSRLLLEDMANIEAWMGIGTGAHGIPNRISYHLDLMGPSAAIDSACASSLTAVHLGCRAIANGESRVAIVGGVHVLLAPALTRVLGVAGVLAKDGICRSFDDDAGGYARGEGGAIVVLKSLACSIANGDNILAVIKGTAVAHDGRTDGIMVPDAKAQALVARQALARAGIDPLAVAFIEAHATSTSLGDPTEISAIQAVYGSAAGRDSSAPAMIGSIKPNIGHLEAAAGIIGLVKVILSLNKGQLAPQAHLNKLNSRIDWEKSGLQVVREVTTWPTNGKPKRAAVCSYGYGGTVCHAIIEEFVGENLSDSPEPKPAAEVPTVLVLSAPQQRRLAKQAKLLADWLSSPDGKSENLNAISNTLTRHRAHHDYRAAFVVTNHDEAADILRRFAAGIQDDTVMMMSGQVLSTSLARRAVWVFSGHGAQWRDMGKELITDQIFRKAIELLEPIYQTEAGFSVLQALEHGNFETSDRVQLVTYAIQLGLSYVLKSRGLEPQAVIGHSVGEIAASVVAEYIGNLKTAGIKTFRIQTDIAFHSPMLDQLSVPLKDALLGSLHPRPADIPLYSTSNAHCRTNTLRNADYWVHNMTNPVHLRSAVEAAAEDGYRIFLEVSSHPIVLPSVTETLVVQNINENEFSVYATMRRDTSASQSIFKVMMQLYTKGAPVNFGTQLSRSRFWSKTVPGTPWVHKPYWRQVETKPFGERETHDVEKYTLLGQRIPVAGSDMVVYSTKLNDKTKPFPGTHLFDGTEIIPAAVYINTFYHATGGTELSNINLRVPVSMGPETRDVQIIVQGETIRIASNANSAQWGLRAVRLRQ